MTVTVYTTTTCPYCTMAKKYLKEKGVEFQEMNVENDSQAAEEMIEKSGQMGVPVLDMNGKIIVGFDRASIDREIAKIEA
jgi:glutaredoxin 3